MTLLTAMSGMALAPPPLAGAAAGVLSAEQAQVGLPVEVSALQPGDLVFFNTTGRTASHLTWWLTDQLADYLTDREAEDLD